MKYMFEKPLKEGFLLKRNSQFTMDVMLDGEIVKAHCPTTNRIGDIETKNIACLVSYHDDPKRKLKYTVEAVSCDELDKPDKNWIGINQILSNRLVEYFLETHQMDEMISDYADIKREVELGISKLDFLVGSTYLEVKTPLTTLNVRYGDHIKTKKVTPFSSTDRFVKHINELAGSLSDNERAIMLTVHQYEVTERKPHLKSIHYEEVKATITEAIDKGLETWMIDMKFEPDGVSLISCKNTTEDQIKD